MIQLYDEANGQRCGTISEDQLQFMMAQLEEESRQDTDYYINLPTLDLFEQQGADAGLLNVLRSALAGREEMDLRWERA